MRKIIASALIVGLVAVPSVALATAQDNNWNDHPSKAWYCRPGEEGFNTVYLTVKQTKDTDFPYLGTLNSDKHPNDETWCANHQPNDVCLNIDGLQTVVPEGYVVNSDKVCTLAPPPVVTPPPAATPQPPVETFVGK